MKMFAEMKEEAIIVLAFIIALCLSYVMLLWVARMAYNYAIFDRSNERTVHQGLIPRLGGLVCLPVASCVVSSLWYVAQVLGYIEPVESYSDILPLILSLYLLYFLGVKDDIHDLSYRLKLLGQIVSVCILFYWQRDFIVEGMVSLGFISQMWLVISYMFFCLLVMNALNLIDGIDGLASSLALLALIPYVVLFLLLGEVIYGLICASVIGFLVAFLKLNLGGTIASKSKIFLGDTGTLSIGFLLSFLAIKLISLLNIQSDISITPIVVISPLLLPCLDVGNVVLSRLRAGKHPLKPDQRHIHHRLLALGLSQRQTLIVLLLFATTLSILNLLLAAYIDNIVLLSINITIWFVFTGVIYYLRKRNTK